MASLVDTSENMTQFRPPSRVFLVSLLGGILTDPQTSLGRLGCVFPGHAVPEFGVPSSNILEDLALNPDLRGTSGSSTQ